MRLKIEITEKEKHILYALSRALLLRSLAAGLAIGFGYVIASLGWISEVNFPYVAGVMFVTLFNFGRDYQKALFIATLNATQCRNKTNYEWTENSIR